ncbi:hypothetical protein BCR33DRAFT_93525 [Rhizoclosmatium globosum]|uniref:SH3 domain-containing protein n=1 Tax=Rhizoclosmatium globosum TaxID=329046 RepID=A0A1Y2CJU9_9FUNG|nr:hypothetical protein BCR33DRAFT_93525 [Rhizoclosmatium globosum]|eukprot:ORY47282.1 hypothetical protein BCR33DRAFT_93525 [Rhizoclosmatium globosum]
MLNEGWAQGKLIPTGQTGIFPICCVTPEEPRNTSDSLSTTGVYRTPSDRSAASFRSHETPTSPVSARSFASSISSNKDVHRVVFGYIASQHDEITVTAGQEVEVLHIFGDGWMKGRILGSNTVGVLPTDCLGANASKRS